jgi:hypothetical protein
MKKNLLAFVLVSAALLVSSMALTGCAIEEEEAATSPFEGSWTISTTSIIGSYSETLTFSGDSWEQTIVNTIMFSYTSKAKGSFTYDEKAKTLTKTTTHASDLTGTLQPLTTPEKDTFTYDISGTALTLTDSDSEVDHYTKK